MQIRQLQIATDHAQDRLVLRVATQANEEYRVFITRRFLRELWPHLARLLGGTLNSLPTIAPDPVPPADGANFDQPFRDDDATYPLGTNPLLATEAVFERQADGAARMTLREGRERSFELSLNNELLQALCAMLRAGNEQVNWDLVLDYDAPPAPRTGNRTSLLH